MTAGRLALQAWTDAQIKLEKLEADPAATPDAIAEQQFCCTCHALIYAGVMRGE